MESKKKKNKMKKREMKEEDVSPPKRNKIEEAPTTILAIEAPNVSEDLEWSTEDLNALIEAIERTIPENDKNKYSSRVAKLNWEEIQFGNHTAEECKEKWNHVLERLRKFRTLKELCDDAKVWAKKPWTSFNMRKKSRHPDLPKKPLTPYLRFYVEKFQGIRDNNPTISMVDLSREAAVKFKELSDKKRKKYQDAYEREMEEWRKQMATFREEHPGVSVAAVSEKKVPLEGPPKPRTAFEFFKLKKMKNVEEGAPKKELLEKIRKQWHDLSPKKKCKFIEKAVKDEERYKEECEEYKKQHPNFTPYGKSAVTKNDLEMLKMRDGKPEKPPTSGYGLFSKLMLKEVKDVPSKEKMREIANRWKSLEEREKQEYNFNAAKMTAKYVEKFQKYLDSIPEEQRDLEMTDRKMKLPSDKKLEVLKTVADSSTRSEGLMHEDSDSD